MNATRADLFRTGDVFRGYEIVRLIGKGAVGEV